MTVEAAEDGAIDLQCPCRVFDARVSVGAMNVEPGEAGVRILVTTFAALGLTSGRLERDLDGQIWWCL